MTTPKLTWSEDEIRDPWNILEPGYQAPPTIPSRWPPGIEGKRGPTITEHANLQGMAHGIEAFNEATTLTQQEQS